MDKAGRDCRSNYGKYTPKKRFRKWLNAIASATTISIVNKSKFETTPIPLPPLPEQRAIVSKIEQLFSDLDNGIDNFRKAQAQLKLYRQSVLRAACEGKLVPTEAELARAEGASMRRRMCCWREY